MRSDARPAPFRVLIAGGGVAALEAALTLHDLAGDYVAIQVVAPEERFSYRPLEVREPFAGPTAPRFELAELVEGIGAELISDAVQSVDPRQRVVQTISGADLPYDALILALGAHPRAAVYPHARTIDPGHLDDLLHSFVQGIELEQIKSAAFIIPDRVGWPLPLYELLLMTAERATAMLAHVELTLITSEAEPLEAFGAAASAELRQRLASAGVKLLTTARVQVPTATVVQVTQGDRHTRLDVSTVIALAELMGPALPGIATDEYGFIPVDDYGRVFESERVFAAGDATNGTLKQGGVSAQQAAIVATLVAGLAGFHEEPEPFRPVLHGVLYTGGHPVLLSGPTLDNPEGTAVVLADGQPLPDKIAAARLGPYLAAHAPLTARA